MLVIVPVPGLNAFEKPRTAITPHQTLTIKGKGAFGSGYGYDSDAGFVVLAGTEMRPDTVESVHLYLITLRNNLLAKGIVAKQNGSAKFLQADTFDSPSTAAGGIPGRTANGRVEWKDTNGRTLREIQQNHLCAETAKA